MDSQLPLVTIVTPSYNQGSFIQDTIESVLSQDYPSFDYWIADGGSTDGTIEILRRYESDPRFHWLSEPDQGQADAVRKGWKLGKGGVLGWINSDDMYKPGAVRRAVDALVNNPDAAFVYSDIDLINNNGDFIQKFHVRQADVSDQLLLNYLIPQQSVFIWRHQLETCGGIRIDLPLLLDQELWLRVLEMYKCKYIPEVWAQQRMHTSTKTQTQWKDFHREFFGVVKEYSDHQIIAEEVRGEALLRATLNMFAVEASDGNIVKSIEYLDMIFQNNKMPFGSLGNSVKHVVYMIRHWHTDEESSEILNRLIASHTKGELSQNALDYLYLLKSYNAYKAGDFKTSHQVIVDLLSRNPSLKKDQYIKNLPLLSSWGKYFVVIKRMLVRTPTY